MLFNLDIKNFLDGLFDTLDPGITKLDNLAGIGKYDVIVLPVKIRLFILSLILSKLMFSYQSTLK